MSRIHVPRRRELPWKSRYTWAVANGLTHPKFSYDHHPDAKTAEHAASLMLRAHAQHGSVSLALHEVHVKGPGDAETSWRRIELRP